MIRAALEDTPVVVLLRSRRCGKTTPFRRIVPDRAFVSLDDGRLHQAALDDPDRFVEGLPPFVTIDDVQRAPALLSAIKRSEDEDRRPGRLLLTGSANLMLLPKVSESLAGCMEIVRPHPLTESEKAGCPGRLLSDLVSGNVNPTIASDVDSRATE